MSMDHIKNPDASRVESAYPVEQRFPENQSELARTQTLMVSINEIGSPNIQQQQQSDGSSPSPLMIKRKITASSGLSVEINVAN